ncbi:hypothetical protein ACFTWF_30865 [Rhodococcus sp. NPDC056960]|uniref:hypothetical protein n=1 Tax=Rhodococcus sp. NPDC056960 TaxID=3345982 RepID=UPI00363B264E
MQFSENTFRPVVELRGSIEPIAVAIGLAVHDTISQTVAAGEAMKRHMVESVKYFEKKFSDVMRQVVSWELYGL